MLWSDIPGWTLRSCTRAGFVVTTRSSMLSEAGRVIIIIIINIYIAHIAEASRRLETEGGVEMT